MAKAVRREKGGPGEAAGTEARGVARQTGHAVRGGQEYVFSVPQRLSF
jgi:hypothetical protein